MLIKFSFFSSLLVMSVWSTMLLVPQHLTAQAVDAVENNALAVQAENLKPEREQGLELLSAAIAHGGDNVIHNGIFQFVKSSSDKPPTEAEIAIRSESVKSQLREQINKIPAEHQAPIQKLIDDANGHEFRALREQMLANTTQKTTYLFAMNDAAKGGEKRWKSRPFKTEILKMSGVEFLFRKNADGTQQTIQIEDVRSGNGRSAKVTAEDFNLCEEPHLIGRANDWVRSVVTNEEGLFVPQKITDLTVKNLGEVEGSETFEVSFSVFEQPGKFVCQIVPDRGYICPMIRIEGLGDNDLLLESEDFFQPKNSELWFPGTHVVKELSRDDHSMKKYEKYVFQHLHVMLNLEINQNIFGLGLVKGETIVDSRNLADQKNYTVLEDFILTIGDLDGLAANSNVEPTTNLPDKSPPGE